MSIKKYDKNGKEISLFEWGRLLENREYRIVKHTELPDGKLVSTVWLGLDHNFNGGPPLIFETMVFADKDTTADLDMERYSTLEEAEKGHELMVKKYT